MRIDVYSRRYDSEGREGWMHTAAGKTSFPISDIRSKLKKVAPHLTILEPDTNKYGPCYKVCDHTNIIYPREIEFSFTFGYNLKTFSTEFTMVSPVHSDRRILESLLDELQDFKEDKNKGKLSATNK